MSIGQTQDNTLDNLTERQAKVLAMLQKGLSKADIAQELGVSVKTVGREMAALDGRFTIAPQAT